MDRRGAGSPAGVLPVTKRRMVLGPRNRNASECPPSIPRRWAARQLVVSSAALVVLTCGTSAAAASPAPPVSFSGTYAVSYKVTNGGNFPPFKWVFSVARACASPCRAVSFRYRLASEKTWHKHVYVFTWNGRGEYVRPPEHFSGYADCQGKAGGKVSKGYDVESTSAIRLGTSVNGRVTRFTGAAADAYVPNAAGLKAGCTPGSYQYALAGLGQ